MARYPGRWPAVRNAVVVWAVTFGVWAAVIAGMAVVNAVVMGR